MNANDIRHYDTCMAVADALDTEVSTFTFSEGDRIVLRTKSGILVQKFETLRELTLFLNGMCYATKRTMIKE